MVKATYDFNKLSIYNLMSKAALGQKLADNLYKPKELPCLNRARKMVPKKIDNFWGIIFDKEDILTEEIDVECFGKIKDFSCLINKSIANHLQITFKFISETEYFSNLELELDVWFDAVAGPMRKIKEEIAYKKAKVDNSIFTLLFDSSTDIQVCYNLASEIYQNYSNALYFYFREEDANCQN